MRYCRKLDSVVSEPWDLRRFAMVSGQPCAVRRNRVMLETALLSVFEKETVASSRDVPEAAGLWCACTYIYIGRLSFDETVCLFP